MLLAGDEAGRTQQGNNNAYCQDNPLSWIDWSKACQPEELALFDFTARLIELRQELPSVHSAEFLHGARELAPGIRDIDWFDPSGAPISSESWANPEGRALALRRAAQGSDRVPQITL